MLSYFYALHVVHAVQNRHFQDIYMTELGKQARAVSPCLRLQGHCNDDPNQRSMTVMISDSVGPLFGIRMACAPTSDAYYVQYGSDSCPCAVFILQLAALPYSLAQFPLLSW